MGVYLIGYEMRGERPYDRLREALDREDAVHLIDNMWVLETGQDAAALRDWVHSMMDDDDAIFVAELKRECPWASRHLRVSANDWLKTRL